MRSLEECRAEVFRRSEKRIRARRRKVHALMVCVPLALCITALSVFIPAGQKHADPPDGHPSESNGGDLFRADICRIDVSEADGVKSITGEEAIRAVMDALAEPDGSDGADSSDGSYGAGEGSCTITLIAQDGSRGVYLLTGNVLTDQGSGRTAVLTRTQAQALWVLLHPETAED